MIARIAILAAGLALAGAPPAAAAEVFACPTLTTVTPVGNCPTAEELRYTFTSYCSDNQRMYDKDDTCTSFEKYASLKNVSLWETPDGSFQGYLPCGMGPDQVKTSKALQIGLGKQGSITRVVCEYENGISMVRREKGNCTVAGDRACTADGMGCKVSCE